MTSEIVTAHWVSTGGQIDSAEGVPIEAILKRHSFKQDEPRVWRRGRRSGRRYVAYHRDLELIVAWKHLYGSGAVTLDLSEMTAAELDAELDRIIRKRARAGA